ncbi:MAG: DNA mismatch repair protein MutL [Calditrichaeota bacterium]|nr:MAG: DNA mismatch repair protein MutL [Calditrichota bacterium]
MNCLTVDFGSTFTKIAAIDMDRAEVLATAGAFTTIDSDITEGFYCALTNLQSELSDFRYDELFCCSSAAGGLKMAALGLVPELTAKAAKTAASSAGAKVVKTFSYEIQKKEQDEIFQINPDLVLLCGGTDGGNKEVIIANAKKLCAIARDFTVIVAGNKIAADQLEKIFRHANRDFVMTENVMPTFNQLNIEPAKECIKDLFIRKIVDAKGLSKIRKMTSRDIIPTPLAVMNGCELYSQGSKNIPGIGDLMAVDIGGATTDIYSMSHGLPSFSNVMVKGIPEPFSKRTVEGDLGMRYSLSSLVEALNIEHLAQELGESEAFVREWIAKCCAQPETLADNAGATMRVEAFLARRAIEIAVERHCGTVDRVFTPAGEVFALSGKDLSEVQHVIGIGGVLINNNDPAFILQGVQNDDTYSRYLKPKHPAYLLDKRYVFASLALLAELDPDLALTMMKKEMIPI